jgi:predicted AAA+ superfamily ATPase
VLEKSLKFWPAVCVVGSRQVGKSTCLREMAAYRYLSFDDLASASLAKKNPSQILTPPLIIDEAQKVPGIFDAVKLDIDREKRPGKYIFSGSVRFSKRTLIRESLTGRAKTLQMFPLVCAETLGLEFENRWEKNGSNSRVSRKDLHRHLAHGGMPAIFAARNAAEVSSYWESLIDSYVYRDLLLAVPKNPRPEVALSILKSIAEILALGELPTFSRILKKTRGARTMLERHLLGLEDLMILHRIPCLGATQSKDIFMPFDSALLLTLLRLNSPQHDAAIHIACLYIALINEVLAQSQYADKKVDLHYAVSSSGEVIHLITKAERAKQTFWKIIEEPVPHDYQLRYLSAISTKMSGKARILSSTQDSFSMKKIYVSPWEMVL